MAENEFMSKPKRNVAQREPGRPALSTPVESAANRLEISFAEDARQQVQDHAQHDFYKQFEISCDLCWGDKPQNLRRR